MKLKKLFAGIAAGAVAVSTMAVSAFAETVDAGVCYNTPYTTTAPDGAVKATLTFAPILNPDDETAPQWNDWCTFKVTVTNADGSKNYMAVVGAQVGWDTTVDDNGTPDNKDDDVGISIADSMVMFSDVEESDPFEIACTPGATIEVAALGWNDTEETASVDYFKVVSIEYEIDPNAVAPAEPETPAEPEATAAE